VWNPLGTYGFLHKNQIKNDEIIRYKAQLAAQAFSQTWYWFVKRHSLVLDATTFQYLIILVSQQGLHLHLMNNVTAYLYDSLKNHFYMKNP